MKLNELFENNEEYVWDLGDYDIGVTEDGRGTRAEMIRAAAMFAGKHTNLLPAEIHRKRGSGPTEITVDDKEGKLIAGSTDDDARENLRRHTANSPGVDFDMDTKAVHGEDQYVIGTFTTAKQASDEEQAMRKKHPDWGVPLSPEEQAIANKKTDDSIAQYRWMMAKLMREK